MQKDGGEDCLPKLSKLKPNRTFPVEVFCKQNLCLCSWGSEKQIKLLSLKLKQTMSSPFKQTEYTLVEW